MSLIEESLKTFLNKALLHFHNRLKEDGLSDKATDNRLRGARQFVAYILGEKGPKYGRGPKWTKIQR